MIEFNPAEQCLADQVRKLKQQSGSHSPSRFTIEEKIPGLRVRIDACFLSNPYATDLFLAWLRRDMLDTGHLRDLLEFYPSQNAAIAANLATHFGLPEGRVFLGNGATEVIQALLHRFCHKRLLVSIPTFSSYYEFVRPNVEVVHHRLLKADHYALHPETFVRTARDCGADTVVLINPNNPDGGYVPLETVRAMLRELPDVGQFILDESFIHFAYEDDGLAMRSAMDLTHEFPNLVLVKSMSKDFGIAGIRAGFGVMSAEKVSSLLSNGYLWNSNGLAEYFFKLYCDPNFMSEYEVESVRYIRETRAFVNDLAAIPGLCVTPSKANFALVELTDGSTADDTVVKLLVAHGIYARTCSDKIGLDGQYLRVASRTAEENVMILDAFHRLFHR